VTKCMCGVGTSVRSLTIFALVLIGLAGSACRSAGVSVKLAWDQVTDPTVIAYNLYYGGSSLDYSSFVSAGPNNSVTVSNLTGGVTYYFAVTAINDFGLESAFSAPVIYRVPIPCTITLGNLFQTYDGTPKSVSATTTPPGLGVSLTYNGQTNSPAGLGIYQIVATVTDPNYSGSVTGTLIVARTLATIQLAGMTWVYDGNMKEASVTTMPPGLPVLVTYNGLTGPPTNAGSYEVNAEIYDPTFTFGAVTNGIFTISKANAVVRLSSLTWNYDGTRKSASVTTVPPGLAVMLTYNGQSQAPYAEGNYTVVASVKDPNYQGSDTQLLTITDGNGGPGLTSPATPFPSSPGSQSTSQVSATVEPLQIRWPTGSIGPVSVFHSTNLAEWALLTNSVDQSGSMLILQQPGNHFYRATISNTGTTNQFPMAIEKLSRPSTVPQPINANPINQGLP
jgi:hypothetical protein